MMSGTHSLLCTPLLALAVMELNVAIQLWAEIPAEIQQKRCKFEQKAIQPSTKAFSDSTLSVGVRGTMNFHNELYSCHPWNVRHDNPLEESTKFASPWHSWIWDHLRTASCQNSWEVPPVWNQITGHIRQHNCLQSQRTGKKSSFLPEWTPVSYK